jgi:hypothetical protein
VPFVAPCEADLSSVCLDAIIAATSATTLPAAKA